MVLQPSARTATRPFTVDQGEAVVDCPIQNQVQAIKPPAVCVSTSANLMVDVPPNMLGPSGLGHHQGVASQRALGGNVLEFLQNATAHVIASVLATRVISEVAI